MSSSSAQPSAQPPILRFHHVTASYREAGLDRPVLKAVDLELLEGQLAVLLGRSGSGKSTLLNLASGIDRPVSGRIEVGGEELTALSEEQRTLFRRRSIGFVFQFYNLIPTLTVEENLLLPLELNGRQRPEDRERALALLAEVGLGDRAKSFPDRLSGGEQQRVAVARALVHDPRLVLADEPTGNLDLETGLEVLDLLDRLTRQAGKTLVMVTHSPEVIGLADRIFRLADGHLTEHTLSSS